jgi:hypothetical protein
MTKTDFDTKYSPIVMPEPFAGSGSKSLPANTQDDASGFSYPLGFNGDYSSPSSNNGKFVTRAQMNAIGNLATHNDFYHRCGGLNTFDPAFASAIGGYPKGAVLSFINNGQLYHVQSLIDNNTVDFRAGVDEVSWTLINSDRSSAMGNIPFFEIANLDATTTFAIGSTTSKAGGRINIEESLSQSSIDGNKFSLNMSSQHGYQPFGGGVMIKDITSGDDGLLPTINLGTLSSGNINSVALVPNGWLSVVGNPGWFIYYNSNYKVLLYPSFTGGVEAGKLYKFLVYCGYVVDVNTGTLTLNLSGIKMSGALKLVYAN